MARNETLAKDLLPWHEGNAGETLVQPGDPVSAGQWLAAAIGDDQQAAALRLQAHALSEGVDLSRLEEHQALDHLCAALVQGRLFAGKAARPTLGNLAVATRPAPAPAPAPAPMAPARAAAAEPPPPAPLETTFGSELDVAAMVAALQQAAQDGVPFCEECARAVARAAA